MKKLQAGNLEQGADHSTSSTDMSSVASCGPCRPSDYLRIRPPYRRFEKERRRASRTHLQASESYLAAITWYRDRLDNRTVHRA